VERFFLCRRILVKENSEKFTGYFSQYSRVVTHLVAEDEDLEEG